MAKIPWGPLTDVLVGRVGGKTGIQQCIVFGHPMGPGAMGQDPHVGRGHGAGLVTTQHRHGSLGDHDWLVVYDLQRMVYIWLVYG